MKNKKYKVGEIAMFKREIPFGFVPCDGSKIQLPNFIEKCKSDYYIFIGNLTALLISHNNEK